MPDEGKFDKMNVSIRIMIETYKRACRAYGKPTDKNIEDPVIRALEDAVRDVPLTPKDYKEIATEIEANKKKREAKRSGRKL